MLTIKEIKDTYYKASGQTSTIARHLCLAGVAITWLFKPEKGFPFTGDFYVALICFVVALFLDFVQYLYKTLAWKREMDKYPDKAETDQVEANENINVVTWICFLAKSIGCFVGYLFLMYAILFCYH
jgi:hypothetical protein